MRRLIAIIVGIPATLWRLLTDALHDLDPRIKHITPTADRHAFANGCLTLVVFFIGIVLILVGLVYCAGSK